MILQEDRVKSEGDERRVMGSLHGLHEMKNSHRTRAPARTVQVSKSRKAQRSKRAANVIVNPLSYFKRVICPRRAAKSLLILSLLLLIEGTLAATEHAASRDNDDKSRFSKREATPPDDNVNQNQNHKASVLSSGKRTLYACEDKQLAIECGPGDSIHLIRANYGRFSIVTCNEFGHLGWSAKCASPSSFEIIENSCQGKQACQLLASNSIFGDACPGTQKYLEVHYQCLASNGTNTPISPANNPLGSLQQQSTSSSASSSQMATLSSPAATTINNKQQALNLHHYPAAAAAAPMINNNFNTNTNNNNKHVMLNDQLPPTPVFPPWMPPGVRPQPQQPQLQLAAPGNALPSLAHFGQAPASYSQSNQRNQQQEQQIATNVPNSGSMGRAPRCPEIVWRQIRWPATEAGALARMPCPSHALAGLPLEQAGAASSFACGPNGHWAMRVHALHCQSMWLRNLTQRVDVGESPLAALSEMAQKTRPTIAANINNNNNNNNNLNGGLFGDDLVEIGRIVRRFVNEDLNEWLLRISDDKQRISFGRDAIQLLVELLNNLVHEQHSDAWADLSSGPSPDGTPSPLTSRKRVAGSLVQSLESGLVIFAALLPSPPPPSTPPSSSSPNQQQSTIYSKINENVLVTIRSIPVQLRQEHNKSIELSFPSDPNQANSGPLFGQAAGLSWWNQMDQRFNLHLQVSLAGGGANGDKSPSDSNEQQHTPGNWQNLKVVYIMTRGLSAQMDSASLVESFADLSQQPQQNRWFVNSNLISISLVADPAYKSSSGGSLSPPMQVALAAPFELVFKHQDIAPPGWNSRQALRPSRCVFWDPTNSEWLQDGCRLVESNRTHSTCACSHLTTFGLLTEWDPTASSNLNEQQASGAADHNAAVAVRAMSNLQRVPLESIENEFQFASRHNNNNNKLLYLAKTLDGHLFGGVSSQAEPSGQPQPLTQARYLVFLSCLASALLLALAIGASLYDRAHTSRLLASIPLRAAPSLLVTTNRLPLSAAGAADLSPATQHRHAPSSSSNTSSRPANGNINQANNSNQAHIWHCQQAPGLYGGWPQQKQQHQQQQHSVAAANADSDLTYEQHLQEQLQSSDPLASEKLSSTSGKSHQLKVPIYILCKLFLIQVLVLLMLISQNWWQNRASQIPQMLSPIPSQLMLQTAVQQQQKQLEPIGQITWLLTLAFYYLISSLACWLLVQFLQLNASLVSASSSIRQTKSMSSNGGSGAPANNAQLAVAIIGNLSVDSSEHDLQSELTTSKATNSNSSQFYQAPAYNYWPAQSHYKAHRCPSQLLELTLFSLTHLLPVLLSAIYFWLASYNWLVAQLNELTYVSSFASQLAAWPLLLEATWFSVTLPIYLIPSICGLSFVLALYSQQRNNSSARKQCKGDTSAGSKLRPAANPYGATHDQNPFVLTSNGQVALTGASSQPMVPNGPTATTQKATGIHLQSHSSSSIRQQQQHPIMGSSLSNDDMLIEKWRCSLESGAGSTSSSGANNNNHNSAINSPKLILPLNHYQYQYANHKQQAKVKLAKLTCAMLIVLLTLHASCWLSFLAHIRQSLENPTGSYYNNMLYVSSGINASATDQWSSYKMLYSFALCNLALVCLVCWCKRRHLVRASQQIGLRRALNYCRYWFCCCFCCDNSSSSSTPASSLMGGGKSEHHMNHQQLGAGYYETTTANGAHQTKISPSSQSLFMISNSQQQLYGTNYIQQQQQHHHHQPTYGVFNGDQQQHLYQPIYGGESSLALNEQAALQRNYQHLATLGHNQNAQRMQNLHQQQQHSFTLSRTNQEQQQHQLMMLDANQTLKQQQQAFYQQQQNSQANSRTLGGYQRALMMKQQQHQGEAEGPLVALGNSGASSSVGSTSNSSDSATANNHRQQQQQQQQQATLGPQQHQQSYEHQMFNKRQQPVLNNNQFRSGLHQQQQSFDNQQLHFRRPSQQQQNQRQLQQQFLARRSSSTEDESGHIYDTAQNCYASLALQ